MGRKATIKLMRKQLANVAKDHYQYALTAEAIADFDKKFTEHASKRMDLIAKDTEREVKLMDSQTREFRKLLMQDIGMQLSRELFEINVSMLAWQNVLLKELSVSDIKEFGVKVEAEKTELRAKLEAEAKIKQAEEAAAMAKIKAEAAAAAKLKAETEGTPVDAPKATVTATGSVAAAETA